MKNLFDPRHLSGPSGSDLGLQCRNPRLQSLVLLACRPRHVLDRLELVALDHVKLAQDAIGLIAEYGVELAPDPRSDARRIVHQPRYLVQEAIGGLGHIYVPCAAAASNCR